LPGSAQVAGDVVSKIGEFLTIYLGLKIGFSARIREKTVKDGDVDIHAGGAIPIGDMVVANGSFADNAPVRLRLGAGGRVRRC
jgi:hypothetical protein